jgi:hypothetical protein
MMALSQAHIALTVPVAQNVLTGLHGGM